MIHNPILPGFNPDPSIIRVDDEFYIATSSFSYFPGLPIYHSKDLRHWELIGHAISRTDQIRLNPELMFAGLCAPTLRYHDGLFYIIASSISTKETYLMTATDPAGPWSDPHCFPALPDPDLYWENGHCYVASGIPGAKPSDTYRVHIQELDTEHWEFVGEPIGIWGSALFDAAATEAPHIYHIGDWYYLLASEGGTEHFHAVTIARSKSLFGPYEGYVGNPILTHRHLTRMTPICNVGHADLVELQDGTWYMVFLGSRIYGGYNKNMGRETFIAPVIWENDWPVVSPDTGKCEFTYPDPAIPEVVYPATPDFDPFDGDVLSKEWNYLGIPVNRVSRLSGGNLYIRACAPSMVPNPYPDWRVSLNKSDEDRTFHSYALGFVGKRQRDTHYRAVAHMHFEPENRETAGVVILQNYHNQLRIELGLSNGKTVLRIVAHKAHMVYLENRLHRTVEGKEYLLFEQPWDAENIVMEIRAIGQDHSFWAGKNEQNMQLLLDHVDGSFLGSEDVGVMVGAHIGMFCSGNGVESENEAAFDSFLYQPLS